VRLIRLVLFALVVLVVLVVLVGFLGLLALPGLTARAAGPTARIMTATNPAATVDAANRPVSGRISYACFDQKDCGCGGCRSRNGDGGRDDLNAGRGPISWRRRISWRWRFPWRRFRGSWRKRRRQPLFQLAQSFFVRPESFLQFERRPLQFVQFRFPCRIELVQFRIPRRFAEHQRAFQPAVFWTSGRRQQRQQFCSRRSERREWCKPLRRFLVLREQPRRVAEFERRLTLQQPDAGRKFKLFTRW